MSYDLQTNLKTKDLTKIKPGYNPTPEVYTEEEADELFERTFELSGIKNVGRTDIETYKKRLDLTTFNEGDFSKKNFLKGEQKTAYRIIRQLMMQLDGQTHVNLSHKEKHIQNELDIAKLIIQRDELIKAIETKTPSSIIDVLYTENKIQEEFNKASHHVSDEIKNGIKEMTVVRSSSPVKGMAKEWDDLEYKKHQIAICEIESKIREKRVQAAQGAKLIKDAVHNFNILQDEIDKYMPYVEKLIKAGITFADGEFVYWSRRMAENSILAKFINNPTLQKQVEVVHFMHPEYLGNAGVIASKTCYEIGKDETDLIVYKNQRYLGISEFLNSSEVPKEEIRIVHSLVPYYVDFARGLDPEQLKAIFQFPEPTRSLTLEKIGLPGNLKDILGIENDEQDTLDNIVDNYRKYLPASHMANTKEYVNTDSDIEWVCPDCGSKIEGQHKSTCTLYKTECKTHSSL